MSNTFNKLKQIENTINKLCLKKYLNLESDHRKRIKCVKTIRLFINTVIDDTIFINISTRILNDFKNNMEMCLYDLIDKFIIIFYNNKNVLEIFEWNNNDDKIESFEIKSKLIPSRVELTIVFKNDRNLFKLSDNLIKLLNKQTDTKSNVIGSLYTYIVKNELLDRKDYSVTLNNELKKAFGIETNVIKFTDINKLVDFCLGPIDDLVIDITRSLVTDIPIEVDDLYQQPKIHNKDVYLLERKIDTLLEIKNNLIKRCKVLEEFSKNPINYINKWVCLDLEEFYNKSIVFRDEEVQKLMYEILKEVI